ncbi:MAG TPA: DUF3021 family protein [Candidatus Scybalomonas excrementigallinarum]|jgi:ABC-type Mn2+/Zn2+ transport system permease subunit|nr:DUF3021 family protein [Candidatus Scybalomonas excrementigallinarum]
MKIISSFIKWYFYITTGILFVCAINMTLSREENIPSDTLWKILLSGFLTTVVTMFFLFRESDSKFVMGYRMILHYLALGIVMILSGRWFGWLEFDISGIVMMLLSVAVVYFLTSFAYYILDRKEAQEINQKLNEKYHDDGRE